MSYERLLHKLTIDGNNWLKENFNMSLRIPIEANGRLKRVKGRYRAYRSGEAINIELAKFLLDLGYEESFETLKHELVHYALHQQGKPFRDEDDYFIQTCNDLGVHLSGTRYVPSKKHVFVCSGCGKEFLEVRKYRDGYYSHARCGGLLNYKKTVIK